MKKLLFLLVALFSTVTFADGMKGKEEAMPPIWIKKQPGTSVVYNKKSGTPVNLVGALDPSYSERVFFPYASLKVGAGQYKGRPEFLVRPTVLEEADYKATTGVFSLAFGVRLDDFRVELEGKTDTGSKDKKLFGRETINGKLYTAALMANILYDFPFSKKFRPYIGAGLGMGYVKGDIFDVSKSTKNLAWQWMAGIGFDLTEHWKLDLGYNYISYGDLTIGEESGTKVQIKDIEGHNITLGTRYEF